MTYDYYGNIVTKNGKTYVYDSVWKDLLVNYGGQTITYDAQGNPLTYLGHNLTWEKGRQLKSFDNIQYTYDASGIRNSKTVYGIRHTFVLDGVKILKETFSGNVIEPLYDNEDSVCGIIYNGTPYYFLKNLQGDVIAITDQTGEVVTNYTYDAWGKVLSISGDNLNIGVINPYRYRGYYYDSEIGMYYLQSRYYDPEVGRFVNSDMPELAMLDENSLSHNLFCYCGNEPVNNHDFSGNFVVRRWMVASFINFILSWIPGINAVHAPIKALAKSCSKKALKSKIKNPLISFIKKVAKFAETVLNAIKNGLKKIWFIGNWLSNKINVKKWSESIASIPLSTSFNKILNALIDNIDVILSVGGAISGILDYWFDKKLNNSIWVF